MENAQSSETGDGKVAEADQGRPVNIRAGLLESCTSALMQNTQSSETGDGTVAEADQDCAVSLESLASALGVATSALTGGAPADAPAASLPASAAGTTPAGAPDSQVEALVAMGFASGDATAALQMCGGDVELAAMQLLEPGAGVGAPAPAVPPASAAAFAPTFEFAPPAASVSYKMVIVVREELRMGAGKVAAQCVHAALGAYRHATEAGGGALSALHIWQMTGEATIVLKVPDLQGIRAVAGAASALNVNTHAVHDAGRTQVEAGSLTCLAVGPAPVDVIDSLTGSLKLL